MAREQEDLFSASDYGKSSPDLEALRQAVADRCPQVRFGGHTRSGARIGECSFRPVDGRSAWVQAPITPAGQRRAGTGRWRFRLTLRAGQFEPWQHADTVDQVVDWIRTQAR